MTKWVRRSAVVAGLVGAGVALRYTVFAPDPVSVEVARVARGRVEETVTNSRAGTVKARRRAKLSPEVGGRVVALPHRQGERVSADEPVLEIDSVLQRSRLDLARREHQAASAQSVQSCLGAERSARELARNRRLAEEGILSADLLDAVDSAARAAAAACDATRAAASASRASVELAERELEKTVLRSPFEGVIAELTIEVGEWTTPSPPALPVPAVLDILDPASIYVSAPMDEVDSARIHPDQAVRVTIDSHPGKSFPGRILAVAPYVLDLQEQNRTVEIEVELQDGALASSLLPGTSADVEVILQVRHEVLRIPTSALLAGDKVLLLTNGELVERPVQIGLRNWDLTEIAGGLVEGDEIVVSLDRPEVKAGAKAVASAQATKS